MKKTISNDNVKVKSLSYFLLLAGVVIAPISYAAEWTGYSAIEYRYFQHQSPYLTPDQQSVSVVLIPEFYHQWDGGDQSIIIAPFLRIDSDDGHRSHFDLREARWLIAKNDWELQLGVAKVFWGVTESQHLVDVINQTDLVEDNDTEDKLGQPMINLSFFKDWGTVDLFVLPYFRERTFVGKNGRLRSQLAVDIDKASYESGAKRRHLDTAIRWSHSIDDWDLALYHFYGTNREPVLRPNKNFTRLNPYYEVMHQTGLELQNTSDAWLWKLEVIRRDTSSETFTALTGGFEYTLYGVFETDVDVGLLTEYLWGDRHNELVAPFENDIFMGTRLAWNDEQSTELLFGVIRDLDRNDTVWNLEASRRIGNRWRISVESRFFSVKTSRNSLYQIRDDDYIQVELARYF